MYNRFLRLLLKWRKQSQAEEKEEIAKVIVDHEESTKDEDAPPAYDELFRVPERKQRGTQTSITGPIKKKPAASAVRAPLVATTSAATFQEFAHPYRRPDNDCVPEEKPYRAYCSGCIGGPCTSRAEVLQLGVTCDFIFAKVVPAAVFLLGFCLFFFVVFLLFGISHRKVCISFSNTSSAPPLHSIRVFKDHDQPAVNVEFPMVVQLTASVPFKPHTLRVFTSNNETNRTFSSQLFKYDIARQPYRQNLTMVVLVRSVFTENNVDNITSCSSTNDTPVFIPLTVHFSYLLESYDRRNSPSEAETLGRLSTVPSYNSTVPVSICCSGACSKEPNQGIPDNWGPKPMFTSFTSFPSATAL